MQRIRKDSETLSSPGGGTVTRVRRDSDRLRNEILPSDSGSVSGQRNASNQQIIREVKFMTFIDLI
jgi:hypothetical protein